MGTWKAPKTAEEKMKLKIWLKKFIDFREHLAEVFGDDEAFDLLDAVEARLREALASDWEDVPGLMNKVSKPKPSKGGN